MTKYEITFISTDEKGSDIAKKIAIDGGFEIIKIEELGQKKLAYPIAKQTSGFYFCLNIDGDGSNIAAIEKKLSLQKAIIRVLIVRKKQFIEAPKIAKVEEATKPVEVTGEKVEEPKTTEKLKTAKTEAVEEVTEEKIKAESAKETPEKVEPVKIAEEKVEESKEKKAKDSEEEKERLKKLEEKLDELLKD